MSEYNIDHIENLRIHELRDFARTIGVASPTTMKKDDLILSINNILENGSGKRGGVYKKKETEEIDFFSLLTSSNPNLLNDLVAQSFKKNDTKNASSKENSATSTLVVKKKPVVSGDENVYYPTEEFIAYNLTLNQDFVDYDAGYDTYCGYLDIHPNGYGIIRRDGFVPSSYDAYLPTHLIAKFNLKKGHLVTGKVKGILENKPRVMYEIVSVDEAKETKKNKPFEEFPYNAIGGSLYLDKFDLKVNKGSRIYINNASLEDCIKLGYDIVEENAARVKLVNVKARPEEHYDSCQKLEVINCPFNKTEVEIVNTVELVVERIKREFEYGKPNVLIIYNFSELIRIFNAAVEGFYEFKKFNIKAINKISNILYLAKNATDKLNISIICMDKNGIPEDIKPIMNSEYMQLFNSVEDILE